MHACQVTLDIYWSPLESQWAPGNIQGNLTGMVMADEISLDAATLEYVIIVRSWVFMISTLLFNVVIQFVVTQRNLQSMINMF